MPWHAARLTIWYSSFLLASYRSWSGRRCARWGDVLRFPAVCWEAERAWESLGNRGEAGGGKWPSLSVLTAGAVKLKRITYPSGCALRVHLMSFMDVSKYELPTSKQTTPIILDGEQHSIKECRNYTAQVPPTKCLRFWVAMRWEQREWRQQSMASSYIFHHYWNGGISDR